jgi:hypothetical protein
MRRKRLQGKFNEETHRGTYLRVVRDSGHRGSAWWSLCWRTRLFSQGRPIQKFANGRPLRETSLTPTIGRRFAHRNKKIELDGCLNAELQRACLGAHLDGAQLSKHSARLRDGLFFLLAAPAQGHQGNAPMVPCAGCSRCTQRLARRASVMGVPVQGGKTWALVVADFTSVPKTTGSRESCLRM